MINVHSVVCLAKDDLGEHTFDMELYKSMKVCNKKPRMTMSAVVSRFNTAVILDYCEEALSVTAW